MDKALLDTDTLSEILKGKNENVVRSAEAYQALHGTLTTSAITVAEIVKGFHKKRREDAIVSFQQTLGAMDVLSLDQDAGMLAGRIYAELEKSGRPIGRADPHHS